MTTKSEKAEKKMEIAPKKATPISRDSALPIISIVLGIVSLLGAGLLTGIPAIILGAIALKKQQGDRVIGIIGVVTGAVGTFFSIIFLAIFAWAFIWAANHPDEMESRGRPAPMYERQRDYFDSQRS